MVPDAYALSGLGGLRRLQAQIAALGGGRLAMSREGDLKAVVHLGEDAEAEALVPGTFPRCWLYRTDVHVVWDRFADGTAGRPEPAVSRTIVLQRRAELDHAAFVERWTVGHAPLAARHHPGIARYIQRVVLEQLTPDTPAADGISSLAYANEDDRRDRQYDSEEGRDAIQADVAGFLDVAAGRRALGPELDVAAAPDR